MQDGSVPPGTLATVFKRIHETEGEKKQSSRGGRRRANDGTAGRRRAGGEKKKLDKNAGAGVIKSGSGERGNLPH